jgi:hypothetical protein
MSYTNGWTRSFSFIVDSNKIYLSPYKIDTTCYGILPDTLFYLIDTFVQKVVTDTSIRTTKEKCFDCDVVAIQIVTKKDTINISQAGNIDKNIWSIINSLRTFSDSGRHQKKHSITFLETRNIVIPLPPKIGKPSTVTKKSGR